MPTVKSPDRVAIGTTFMVHGCLWTWGQTRKSMLARSHYGDPAETLFSGVSARFLQWLASFHPGQKASWAWSTWLAQTFPATTRSPLPLMLGFALRSFPAPYCSHYDTGCSFFSSSVVPATFTFMFSNSKQMRFLLEKAFPRELIFRVSSDTGWANWNKPS